MSTNVKQSVIFPVIKDQIGLFLIAFLALFILSACGSPASTGQNAVADTSSELISGPVVTGADLLPDNITTGPVVVFLGDSLTAGFGLPTDAALPDQLAREMQALGVPIVALNAGVSGDTTANGLARYNWSVRAARPDGLPDMLVVALGANDYLSGLDASLAQANLAAILDKAQEDGIPVILAGLQPRSRDSLDARDKAFAAIYPDLSADYNVPLYPALLDGVRDNPVLLQADGLHPTSAGVAKMAAQLAPFLANELQKTKP